MNSPSTIIFDLDETLAESKQALTPGMATLLARLLLQKKVGIISGGSLSQFLKQIVAQLPSDANLANLYLLPTCGAALYTHEAGEWHRIYAEALSPEEARMIETVMRDAAQETGLVDFSKPSWGERIEYREAQVTLSALGQQAPLEEKKAWDPDHAKRKALVAVIVPLLPDYSIKVGGATSIDVTREGIDKAFGVRKLSEFIHEPISTMLYIGDALFVGGNDEIVKETGIATRQVDNPADTARVIEEILSASLAVPAE